jgi:tetratricopeptide (TPR) repeat protein
LAQPATAQDLPESSPEAIRHHVLGLELYLKTQYGPAIEHFTMAHRADPTFVVPLFMAALSHGNAGRTAQADSLYAIVAQHKDRLSPYYRARLETHMAARAGDLVRSAEIARQLARDAAGTKAVYNWAQIAANRNRPGEARDALRTLDPEREPMKGWGSYFDVYTGAAHAVGDYDDELRAARQGMALFPGVIGRADDEALALASLGRVAELETALEGVTKLASTAGNNPGGVMVNAAQELAAHGKPADAKRIMERGLAWFESRTGEEAASEGVRSGRAYALYSVGRHRDAMPLYEALARDFPNNSAYQAWVGVLAGLSGDRARANDVARRIETGEIQFNQANSALWRGLIANALGDRDRAVALLKESGVRARWMHRDPTLMARIQSNPEWVAYLKPEG